MPITPLAPTPPPRTNRRGAATRTDSDLTATKWPLIAGAAYTKLSRLGTAVDGDPDLSGVNRKLVRLSVARNRLWSTMQAVAAAVRECNPQVQGGTPDKVVYNALRALHERLAKELLAYPLEVR